MTGVRGHGRSVRMGLWVAWVTCMAVGVAASWMYVLVTLVLDGDIGPFLRYAVSDTGNFVVFAVAVTATAVCFTVIPALFGIFVLVWPFHLWSERRRRVSRGHYLAGGLGIAVVAGLPYLGLQIGLRMDAPLGIYCGEAVAILVAGPVAMLTFWAIVRPDRVG